MNKRWFAVILPLVLLFGCAGKYAETAPSEALYETKPTDIVGFSSFYAVPETGGAVHALPLDTQNAEGFRLMGRDILIFSGYPNTRLTLLDGQSFACKAELALPLWVSPEDPGVTVTEAGITYVDEASRELVFLDSALDESNRTPLPEDAGSTVYSAGQQLLYYCTADAIRILDLKTGTDRPLREMDHPCQTITALHCDGAVLQCSALYKDGCRRTLFLSAEDGRLLYEAQEEIPLWTAGNLYFFIHMDGEYRELLSGCPDFGPNLLVTEPEPEIILPVLSRRLVILGQNATDGGTILDGYHLETGRRIAHAALPEQYTIADIQACPQENSLWLLCHDRVEAENILFRWDLSAADPADPHTYLQSRWTCDNPDNEGLAQCEELAEALSQKHGIRVRIWNDGAEIDGDSLAIPEYQVPLIRQLLQQLDQELSRYPEDFLEELAAPTSSGRLNFCLVRSISDSPASSRLYWDDRRNIYLVLTAGPDFASDIHMLLGNLIASRVLGSSDAYDGWNRANPSVIGHRERVQILTAAMADGQEVRFSSGHMQSTLRQLCLGIREAFQTARSTETLPWEQYLKTSP